MYITKYNNIKNKTIEIFDEFENNVFQLHNVTNFEVASQIVVY